MELKEYKNLASREDFFWWNVGRRRILKDVLLRHVASRPLKILDVGCGPGGNILFLGAFGEVTGLDASDEALAFAQKRGFARTVKGEGGALPFGDETFDVVSLLDVLEHIEDDAQTLREIVRVLKPGGLALITVPAYPWMWSEHDEALHHRRRYRAKELRAKVERAHFAIKEFSYFVFPSIPFRIVKLCVRKTKTLVGIKEEKVLKTDDVMLPPFLNSLFIAWLELERGFMKFFSLPFGSSLLVLARKPL